MSLGERLLEGEDGAEALAHFNVKQVHLGFCPEDVILEVRADGVVLCDDDRVVVSYPFTNLVMWSAHQHRVMLMTQDNLRRIVIRCRSSRDAKRIAQKLAEQAEAIKDEQARRELLGLDASGGGSTDGLPKMMSTGHSDVHARDKFGRSIQQNAMATAEDDNRAPVLDFRDEIGADLEEFRAFQVQQSHLLRSVCSDDTVVLRIDRAGIKLVSRYTGEELEVIDWFQLLMWKADDSAVVLVMNNSNKQIRLMTAAAEDVLSALIQFSTSVRESMELRKAQVVFRKELLTFQPVKFKTQDAWSKARKQGGLMSKMPWGSTVNLAESLQTRDQLHAVFSMHDKNASGSLDSSEILSLLKSLHMDVGQEELVEIMDDMEANVHREVEFDSFVKWVLSSTRGADASGTLRRRIAHKKKEVDALLAQFEQIDEDGNGTMDKHEFAQLLGDMGLSLNDQELEYTWRNIDQNGSGEIDFEEFVAWFKADSGDRVTAEMRRVLRLTTILTAAKGALVYAVDPGSRAGKKALKDLFDYLDDDGSTNLGPEELTLLVEDLHIDAVYTDVLDALDEIDRDGNREIDFEEFTKWWCGSTRGPAGTLRSKLKLAAFTSRKVGSVLTVVDTSEDGVEESEKYMNQLLSAAFTTPNDMEGSSLGIFGIENPLRKRCHAMILNPYTDRILLSLIFANVGLIAIQTPGGEVSEHLAIANAVVMIIFTAEMWMRIIANGFFIGESAFMSNGWNVFDFCILSAVWVAYAASLFLNVPRELSYSLVMLRSLRALRFFVHIRNILSSIVSGRTMLTAVVLMLLFIFLLFYVVGYQTYAGTFTVQCAPMRTNCTLCVEELWTCPDSIVCENENERCFRVLPNITAGLRSEHTDKYGFDSFGQALLSLSTVVTLDDWREIGNEFRTSNVASRTVAWPIFAVAVVALGLFSVNLFAASLAYSYIKVRKHARNLEAANNTKKNLVEKMLVEKSSAQIQAAQSERHYLQHLNPSATRQARHIIRHKNFGSVITSVVAVNIVCMAGVSHDMSPNRVLFFEIAEAIFTFIYTCECLIKLQALGFKEYFSVLLNRLDFTIVCASLSSYVLQLLGSDSRAKSSSVFRLMRLLKLFRAARIAKLIFRNQHIKEMVARAFAGIESLMSLVVFILFALCLAAIAGMNLLYQCSGESKTSHSPSFKNFFQSLLVVFQVFTADSWGQVMYNTIECAGYSAAVFFVLIVCICYMVLGNLFVAIFMENLEIDDDEKRDKQVLAYMESVAMGDGEGPQTTLKELHHAMDSVSNMLTETSRFNVLQRKGPTEFMRAARLVRTGVRMTGKGISKIGGLAVKKSSPEGVASPTARRMQQMGGAAASMQATGAGIMNKVKSLTRGNDDAPTAAVSEYEIREKKKLTQTEKAKLVLESATFNYFQITLVVLAIVHSALDPTVVTEVATLNSTALANGDLSGPVTRANGYWFLLAVDIVLFVAFTLEMVAKTYAYSLCAGPESVLQTGYLTFELFLVILQYLVMAGIPYTRGLLALRSLRMLYLIERFRTMIKAFIASLSAVWTILILMAATFLAFGIVGMGLYSGRLWYCHGAELLDKEQCEAMHAVAPDVVWRNRDYHFDNILESMVSLFIVWTLQGWTTLWYWTMDATEETWAAPKKDNDIVASFAMFATFIIWNSFMLTKLFTGMLCDFFSQSSGSVLMTAEQRNWQFMSMFLGESLKHEISRPNGRWSLVAFTAVHNFYVRGILNITIVLSVLSMIGQQSLLESDPTGITRHYLLILDEYILVVYSLEMLLNTVAFGPKSYVREYKIQVLVVVTLWITVIHSIMRQQFGIHWLHWVQSIQFVRGLRLVTVFTGIHSIKKIYFLLCIALPQVLNLIGIMSVIFFVLGCCAQHLCSDAPRGDTLTDLDNFDTVISSIMLLFQICTGQSLMGVTTECRAVAGPTAVLFFITFFVTTNMLLVNLFIALLLDNFDLMGSEDMAVSDMDIELFKRTWQDCGLDLHGTVNIQELQSFVNQSGMGTFSMMPKADHHYFNRVLFELGMTHEDVRRGKKEVEFFPLILALCHIRFSSSCLSIADEVDKSQRLVRQHEQHAARVIQVQARAWIAWRNPPRWVQYKKKGDKTEQEEVAELDSDLAAMGQHHDTRSESKKQWDFTVELATIWCMHHLIRVDRITPEHVVAEAFGRLQELVDKGASNHKLMKLSSEDTEATMLSRMRSVIGRSTDSMSSSTDTPKQLTRQRTTDFSGRKNADDESASGLGRGTGKSRKKKTKETTRVVAQNPLLAVDSSDEESDGSTKVSNPLLMAMDSEDDKASTATKSARKTAPVDKRLVYESRGKHKHWLAETYEEDSEEDAAEEEVKQESYRARRARKKLEALKAKQQALEDRRNGVVPAKQEKQERRFRMGRFRKAAEEAAEEEESTDHINDGSETDSTEHSAPKSNLPHWLAEPSPASAVDKRSKRKNQSVKVSNPLFDGGKANKTTVVNPLNTVSNPLMGMDSQDLSSDSDDEAGVGHGLSTMQFKAPSIDDTNTGGATAADVQATLDFKKKKAFMSRKTTIS